MKEEKFPCFPKVTSGSINELGDLKKKIVITVIDTDRKKKINQRYEGFCKQLLSAFEFF